MLAQLQITVHEKDCQTEGGQIELLEYSEGEISIALTNGSLTADQCLWMHNKGMSWEIVVLAEE